MTTVGAILAACLAGWLVDAGLERVAPFAVSAIVSFVLSTLVFYFARNWLKGLRGE